MRWIISIILFSCIISQLNGQIETYSISLAPFSSPQYDEFSPVYYKNKIVFCSNYRNAVLMNFSTDQGKGLFKIFEADTNAGFKWKDIALFSEELKSKMNDGPVTFNQSCTEIYYSRNQIIDGSLDVMSSAKNKLGIYSAILVDGKWTRIREFRFNNEWYNMSTPFLSPDGTRLYFASDKPGGYGGSDLYYCPLKNDYWDSPVNLGPIINTSGNESYPFIDKDGNLYFSSDGHGSKGGKDIFYSMLYEGQWLAPVDLDAPINSKSDDFGFVINSKNSEGYFSSNRGKTVDIYKFKKNYPQISYCTNQIDNPYCISFKDDSVSSRLGANFDIVWSFGDGTRSKGTEVGHCYSKPGIYKVREDIIDKKSGKVYFNKRGIIFQLNSIRQGYIDCPVNGIKGESLKFNSENSSFANGMILSRIWDFGDGVKAAGVSVNHTFLKPGNYTIKLGVSVKDSLNGSIYESCVMKKLVISNNSQELKDNDSNEKRIYIPIDSTGNYTHIKLLSQFSAKNDLSQQSVYQLEILSSKVQLSPGKAIFRNVPMGYEIKEVFQPSDSTYSYVVDEDDNLASLYSAYHEMQLAGYDNACIRIHVLSDPAEKELKKIYGLFSDAFFEENSSNATPGAYPILDQVIEIMNKYPRIKIEIAAHSDDQGSASYNLELSIKRAQSMANYLVRNGISRSRIITKGYGKTRPISPGDSEDDKKINRRVEFVIINE